MRQSLRRRFAQWLEQRIPPARSITLNQRRIFILPSRTGVFFAVCLCVMLLAAINFQNNLSYALTFLLATLFVVATLHTYGNLAGLTIHAVHARPAFPGQHTEFELLVERGRRREHVGLSLHWPDSSVVQVSLLGEDRVRLALHAPVGRERGWYKPGRLVVESWYPLGLLRCWSLVDLDLPALVYPQPLASAAPPGVASADHEGSSLPQPGNDDFYGFRDYQQSDSLRQIYWKGLARGRTLQVAQYVTHTERSAWLDWEMFAGLGTEQRLSHLCYWALEMERVGEDYGLRLPGVSIAPGRGELHRDRVLRALALYGRGSPA
ncbi:DUF58 domain-containing protein [Mangrovimicrobium sediminis]|uniref:DUF58 domain-containing protein n=1 Tax=Mangrovimicrobium sediminis TaxID=2562682 RepID=A0A4Z0LW01_9GAMM|nr:DUF58 domain-containing protein [Haliea sp. SAOS-164]